MDAFVRPAKAGRFQAIGRLSGRTVSIIFAALGSEGVFITTPVPPIQHFDVVFSFAPLQKSRHYVFRDFHDELLLN
ncbi:MAG: hypothetical protein V6Z86_07280 [Hyphomicrobiales bacterium]